MWHNTSSETKGLPFEPIIVIITNINISTHLRLNLLKNARQLIYTRGIST
jgi:hypothetical protein